MFKQTPKTPKLIQRVLLVAVLCTALVISFVATLSRSQQATAATSSTINFQARLLTASGNLVPDGLYNIEFKLYDTESSGGTSQGSCSGNCVWMETRTASDRVRVVNGYLTVNLGSVDAFGSSINWDQELWLTMNVGGITGPSWDGEMSPRLKLTGVPYAFRAGSLVGGSGANTTTLNTGTPSGNNTIQLPAETGTVCLQNSASCGFLTGSTSSYIQNQNASSQTTANFWISGTGRADTALQAPLLDTATATALNIGTTNATAINLNQNTAIAASKTLTVNSGATSLTGGTTGDALTVSNNTSTGNIAVFKDSTTTVATIANGGAVAFTNSVNSSLALEVKNAAGGSVLAVNTTGTGAPVSIGRAGVQGHTGQVLTGIYQSSSSNQETFSYSANVPAGRTVIGSLTLSATTLPTVTISDTKGNTYTVDAGVASGSVTTTYIFSSRITNALTTSDTITIQLTAGTGRWLVTANAFDNLLVPAIDQISTNTGANTSMTTNATPTTTANDELVYGAFGFSAGRTFTPGGTFTGIAQVETTAGSNDRSMGSEWKYITTTGAQTATATISVSGVYTAAVATYRSAPSSLTGLSGGLGLFDGGNNGYQATLGTNTLTNNRSVLLGDESGTVCIQNSTNCGFALATGSSNYIQNGTSLQTANFYIQSAANNSVGGIIRGHASQTSSLFQLLDGSSGLTVAQFTNNGYLHLGSDSISRTGQIVFHDGTLSNSNTVTLIAPTAVSTSSKTITLPDETGTVCLQNSTNCGFAAGSGDADYIQNGTAVQTANYAIRSAATGSVGAVVQGANGQSADIFRVQTWDGSTATSVLTVGNAGLLTVGAGLTATGTVQVNASANNNTSINTGSSTGTVTIGGGSAPIVIDSTNFDVTSAGAVSGVTTLATSGAINGQTISSAANFTGTLAIQGNTTIGDDVATDTLTLNATLQGSSPLVFEGTSADANETTFTITNPTDDRTITFGDEGGTVCLQGSTNCGFATGSGDADYIQNGTAVQTANYAIRSAATGSVAGVIQGANGQSVDIFRVQTWNGSSATTVVGVSSAGLLTAGAGITVNGTAQLNASTNSDTSINTGTSTGTITIGGGSSPLVIDSTNFDVSSAGALSGITTIATSGAINGQTISSAANFTGTVTIQGSNALTLGTTGTNTGAVIFRGSTAASGTVTLQGPANPSTNNYTLSIPALTANATICTDNSVCTGYAPASGSTNYIQNTTTVQTANYAIRSAATGSVAGVIQGASGQSVDILRVQTWNGTSATTVLGVSSAGLVTASAGLTVSGNLGQSTGTVSLASSSTSSYTSSGATTITAGAGSIWSTSAGDLTVQAGTTSSLILNTGGAGTVALGNTNSTTIDIGRGSDIARTIRIGNAGSSTAQAITMGSTGSTSTTTIQGGTGATAISLTTGTNGSINATTAGTGDINLTSADNITFNGGDFNMTTSGATTFQNGSDSTAAFRLQRQNNDIMINFDTSNNRIVVGNATASAGTDTTLFVVDSATTTNRPTGQVGALYYDSTIGRIQCYEADGWGSCGSAPDNIIILTPEFAGATLNGTGIGTMTSDFCAQGGLNVNTSLCPSGVARNFYKWTSPQGSGGGHQVYSIYVSYKLPSTFSSFADDNTIQLTGRTDNTTNGIVSYELFKSTGSAITACGPETNVTSTVNTWQTVSHDGNESTTCAFSGGNTMIVKINMKSHSNANVYVGELSFIYTNN